MKIAIFAVLMSLAFGITARSEIPLKYEPSVVTLQGTLSLQDFAGPPNYKSVKAGDQLERAWILILNHSVRVVAPPEDELYYTQENVEEIQLVCLEECEKKFAFSAGGRATLVGTLFSAHTGHHHKSVLMNVQSGK